MNFGQPRYLYFLACWIWSGPSVVDTRKQSVGSWKTWRPEPFGGGVFTHNKKVNRIFELERLFTSQDDNNKAPRPSIHDHHNESAQIMMKDDSRLPWTLDLVNSPVAYRIISHRWVRPIKRHQIVHTSSQSLSWQHAFQQLQS
mmetsp:Transcript_28303/g.65595  ORF Transcript_28303/g.65595 Transcript_28303/m.65595 type:complete len:143 (-) Transcript_28303:63-491(-)